MSPQLVAFVGVWAVIGLITWNVEDKWKRLCYMLLAALSIMVLRVTEYHAGYDKGSKDTLCVFAVPLEKKSTTGYTAPEYCKP